MKLLLTHRYFWPDTAPYASMLRTIGEALAGDGHEVHVFASRPSYRGAGAAPFRETLGPLHVRRCWVFAENRANPALRAVNVALYCLRLLVHIALLRPDVVTASTFPPVLAGWFAALGARLTGARFVYHLQDIHPEVSQLSGGALGRGPAFRLLRWLDNQTLRRADTIVTLSEDMADTLRARLPGRALPIRVINNFALEAFDAGAEPPSDLQKANGIRRVIFAGNLGRFQNLPLLTDGVSRSLETHPDVELLLLGDGAALPELQARWSTHPQVRFGPFLPFAQAAQLIAEADVGLVSLTPGIYRVAYPSKVLTYLGLGVPVLALVEPESRLAATLADNGLGAVAAAPTPEAISQALDRLLNGPASRESVQIYHDTHLGKPAVLARWSDLMAAHSGS